MTNIPEQPDAPMPDANQPPPEDKTKMNIIIAGVVIGLILIAILVSAI